MIYVKYKKLTDTAMVPTRGSARAAGYDLYADTDKDIMMWPGEVVEFFTGLALEIPDGYFGAVSGLCIPDPDWRRSWGCVFRTASGSSTQTTEGTWASRCGMIPGARSQ